MASFCFVSFAQPAHCDFGGMSFVRTAQELMHRGHEVRWVLSRHSQGHLHARGREFVKGFGISLEDIGHLFLTGTHRYEDALRSIRTLKKYIASEEYDCVVVDRFCIGAAFAAHAACIPWAAVGTDGRERSHQRLRSTLHPAIIPEPWESQELRMLYTDLCREDFPKPSDQSNWATSPFLNISFFPRTYYEDGDHAALPAQSHFLGSGPSREPLPERKQLLITFGNAFNPVLRRRLVDIVRPFLRKHVIPTLVLTGEETVAQTLRKVFQEQPHVTVKAWVPYDEAYRGARVAVGHGGTSHIWYGMREGTPLLAVPLIGDQFYGGCQLERLNVGRMVPPSVLPWLRPDVLRKFGKMGIHLSKRSFVSRLQDVLTDEKVLGSSLRLSRLMRTGGGVEAGASLLERLARERECISTCVSPACCC
jgi:UDP:flavonoid glycosyltransferase YjiC (YdhE family)